MAGYIGSKTVSLSTTGADIAGDADVSGALDVGGAFTSQGIDDNATSTAMTLDTSNNVGIGTSSPSYPLHVSGTGDKVMAVTAGASSVAALNLGNSTNLADGGIRYDNSADALILRASNAEKMRIDSSGNVGIGTDSPSSKLHVSGTYDTILDGNSVQFTRAGPSYIQNNTAGGYLVFQQASGEAMRIDSSGNLLVGTTVAPNTLAGASATQGVAANGGTGYLVAAASGTATAYFNRQSTDGDIVQFRKDGSTVGSIGVLDSDPYIYIGSGDTGFGFLPNADAITPHNISTNSARDNAIDLGYSTRRWDDIYATNGTIQTSDRNEKQDIAELSDAEQRVAVAAKGLMRKFRWRDAVEAKGDEARTHFGVIAQDLQAAFVAEGLDAGDYAMFISTTWWETQTEVPAVEAVAEVLDEDGNVVTEAVEAADAYTRTDTYDTQEEAPEGATERTRLGVRYSELLAFIIGAL